MVMVAYLIVVLIWATTPLAIQWSSESVSFSAAVVLRMMLALAFAVVITAALRRPLFSQAGVWKNYLAASIGIFPNMPLVYWSAQFIPSGLMAVIFSFATFITGLLSILMLRENPFNSRRIIALMLALVGLIAIFHQQMRIDARGVYGVAGMLGSCVLFSFSSVWLKRLDHTVDAFAQTTGSLLFAMPGLLLCWWWQDGELPQHISAKSLGAIGYLGVFGSLLGFTLFFYVLKRLSASAVSLITLITPILALLLGAIAAGEQLSVTLLAGAVLVIVALLLYLDLSLRKLPVVFYRRKHSAAAPAANEAVIKG